MSYKDSHDLKLVSKEKIENKLIENYFPYEDKGLIIYKNMTQYIINLNQNNSVTFKGIYDFDSLSKTLIICKYEGNNIKVGLYYNKSKNKNLNLKYLRNLYINEYLLNEDSKLHKIMLIPCLPGYENQSVLLFINKEIRLIKIKDSTSNGKAINLSELFNFNNFNELQFIIYVNFLLILKFDEESKLWRGKIISLLPTNNSIKMEIENNINIELNVGKNAKFSFSEIKDKKYLFSLISEDNKPKVYYWEIFSQLSGMFTNYTALEENENIINESIPLGNCVVNYFYHCFDKYPLLGAIEYNFKKFEKKKTIKLSFFYRKSMQ